MSWIAAISIGIYHVRTYPTLFVTKVWCIWAIHFESPRIARYRSTTVSPSNPASNSSTSSYYRRHCVPERSCKIIERSFDVRISNECARTRDKAETGRRGRKKGRGKRRNQRGGPSANVTFGEPVKKKKRDAPYVCVYIHACKVRARARACTRLESPHIPLRTHTRGPVCIGSKNWSKKERKTERGTGGRGIVE